MRNIRVTIDCFEKSITDYSTTPQKFEIRNLVSVLVVIDVLKIVNNLQEYSTDGNGNWLISDKLIETAITKAKALLPGKDEYRVVQIEELEDD